MRISDWSSDVCSSDLLAAWERTNGVGRLIKKTPADVRPTYSIPEGFTLHHGDFGSGGVIVMVVTMTWHVTSPLYFEVIEAPAPGMVRVLTQWDGVDALRHLAPAMATAQSGLASHRSSHPRFDVVCDEADAIPPTTG